MAAKKLSVTLPPYSDPLLRKHYANTPETYAACFERLVTHYGLAFKFGYGFGALTKTDPQDAWRSLSFALMSDFVPAFQTVKRRGRKKASYFDPDAAQPGGFFASLLFDYEKMAKAQFVLAVNSASAGKRLSDGFRSLSKNAVKRNTLPKRFRSLKTEHSLKEAYYKIDPEIRRNPQAYLPKRPTVIPDGIARPTLLTTGTDKPLLDSE